MPLGTNLVADVQAAITPSDDPVQYSVLMATAIDNYVVNAVYANGSLTYVAAASPPDFILPTEGTIADAALSWATAINNYWGVEPTVGVPGVPTGGGVSVVSGTISHATVLSIIQGDLIVVFTSVQNSDTLVMKATQIAAAIESGITTITTSHTELAGNGSPLGPFPGVIA